LDSWQLWAGLSALFAAIISLLRTLVVLVLLVAVFGGIQLGESLVLRPWLGVALKGVGAVLLALRRPPLDGVP
jgi:uncharacterized membrane protein